MVGRECSGNAPPTNLSNQLGWKSSPCRTSPRAVASRCCHLPLKRESSPHGTHPRPKKSGFPKKKPKPGGGGWPVIPAVRSTRFLARTHRSPEPPIPPAPRLRSGPRGPVGNYARHLIALGGIPAVRPLCLRFRLGARPRKRPEGTVALSHRQESPAARNFGMGPRFRVAVTATKRPRQRQLQGWLDSDRRPPGGPRGTKGFSVLHTTIDAIRSMQQRRCGMKSKASMRSRRPCPRGQPRCCRCPCCASEQGMPGPMGVRQVLSMAWLPAHHFMQGNPGRVYLRGVTNAFPHACVSLPGERPGQRC